MCGFWMVGQIEGQCIYCGNWVCVYGEYVVQDIVDVGGCVLMWFDIVGVVMVFYFEDYGLIVVDIDDVCIFVWVVDDLWVVGW